MAGELGPSCSVTTVACDLVCSSSAKGRAGKTESDVLSGLWVVGSPRNDRPGPVVCALARGWGEGAREAIEGDL